MTNLKTIDLTTMVRETLAEMANEAGEQVELNARHTVEFAEKAGRYLAAAKEQTEHGEWASWLEKNWKYSQPTAQRYMQIASNYSCMNNLKDASSINQALKKIADSKPKKPKSAKVTPDPDPAPNPATDPTTNRKKAKGSEKVSEDKKPRTQPVPVEFSSQTEDPFAYATFSDCIKIAETKLPQDDPKALKIAAKHLRKLADKLDPPTKFRSPDLSEVSAYFAELKAVDPDSFFDFYESKGWLVGKVSMKDWRASARKWVRENAANGKGNGNGAAHRGTGKRRPTVEEVFG